ncbi:MAG: hypothetical protein WCZ65_06390 [Lysobacteraceae bacterium]
MHASCNLIRLVPPVTLPLAACGNDDSDKQDFALATAQLDLRHAGAGGTDDVGQEPGGPKTLKIPSSSH